VVIDTVRASRDGHQFHEAWVARCALALLLPRNGLYAIAVEGLAEEDEEDVSAATVEVADATLYFGNGDCAISRGWMTSHPERSPVAATGPSIRRWLFDRHLHLAA